MSYEDMSKAAVLEAEAGHLVETIERLTRERDALVAAGLAVVENAVNRQPDTGEVRIGWRAVRGEDLALLRRALRAALGGDS